MGLSDCTNGEGSDFSSLPMLDLSLADSEQDRPELLRQLRQALFDIGFLYITNHGVPQQTIDNLTTKLPALFDLPLEIRKSLTKLNSPHFLGYNGLAEETTLGKQDLREQFDFASELPVIWQAPSSTNGSTSHAAGQRDFSQQYWRLRGPNQWPPENLLPGFRDAFLEYLDAVANLAYRFVHLVEEAFGIPVGTFDAFWSSTSHAEGDADGYLPPQHRIKLLKYPPNEDSAEVNDQGVGPHKDSSGWLTFLYQVGQENALEVVNSNGDWIPAPPVEGSFVVNFGNPFEAATAGAVRATIHRVKATSPNSRTRYSIPFFQGLPLDLTVSEIQSFIPEKVRSLRKAENSGDESSNLNNVSSYLDPRWDSLGESQLRKWIRSHQDVAAKWYGTKMLEYYLS